jgi:hypothetical protein
LYNLTFKHENVRYIHIIKILLIVGFAAIITQEIFLRNKTNILLLIVAAAVFLFMAWIERRAKTPAQIEFSSENIIFNGMMKKKYNWSEIQNVVLKDALLTVDFKNNKLMQREIEEELDEAKFNNWARKHLQ